MWPLVITEHQDPASSQGCDEAVGSVVDQATIPTSSPGQVADQLLSLAAVSRVLQPSYGSLNCRGEVSSLLLSLFQPSIMSSKLL